LQSAKREQRFEGYNPNALRVFRVLRTLSKRDADRRAEIARTVADSLDVVYSECVCHPLRLFDHFGVNVRVVGDVRAESLVGVAAMNVYPFADSIVDVDYIRKRVTGFPAHMFV
jgi:hypothetical protein